MKKYISSLFKVDAMRSSLITILLSSEKRTDLLLLLKEKPRTIEEINDKLDTNSVAILPQLKKLKEMGLVAHEDRAYDLSLIGKIIVRKMEPLVKAFRLLEDNYDYWSGLKSGEIPPGFFKRMEEFVTHMPGRYHGDDTSSAYREMTEALSNSKKVLLIIPYPNSRYPGICAEHAEKGSKVSVVLTQQVFETYVSGFKKELDTLLFLENSDVYVLDNNIAPPSVAVTDKMVLTCFSPGKNTQDENRSVAGFGEEAVKWGLELFEYFKALAKPFVLEPANSADFKQRR
jgi:predicted transcriptional regulator